MKDLVRIRFDMLFSKLYKYMANKLFWFYRVNSPNCLCLGQGLRTTRSKFGFVSMTHADWISAGAWCKRTTVVYLLFILNKLLQGGAQDKNLRKKFQNSAYYYFKTFILKLVIISGVRRNFWLHAMCARTEWYSTYQIRWGNLSSGLRVTKRKITEF